MLRDPRFSHLRGAAEWYVLRQPLASPRIAVIGLQGPPDLPDAVPATRLLGLKPRVRTGWWARLRAGGSPCSEPSIDDLLQAVMDVDEPHVLLLANGVRPLGNGWWWEAAKLFELHPEVAIVCGVLTDRRDCVVRGIEVLDDAGQLVCPQVGQPATAAGPFALWLKPQCADAAATDFCFVETALLRETLISIDRETTLRGLGLRLAERSRNIGRLVAWTPLMKAVIGPHPVDGRADDLPKLADFSLSQAPALRAWGQRSRLARYLQSDTSCP